MINRLSHKSNLLSVVPLPNIDIYLISTLFAQRSIHLRHFLFSESFFLFLLQNEEKKRGGIKALIVIHFQIEIL